LALAQSCVTVPHLLQHVARHLLRLHQSCVTRVSVEQGGLKSHLFTRLFSQNPRLPHVPNDGLPGVSIATARSPSLSIAWFPPPPLPLFRIRLRGRRLLPRIRPSVSGPLLPGPLDDTILEARSFDVDGLVPTQPTNHSFIFRYRSDVITTISFDFLQDRHVGPLFLTTFEKPFPLCSNIPGIPTPHEPQTLNDSELPVCFLSPLVHPSSLSFPHHAFFDLSNTIHDRHRLHRSNRCTISKTLSRYDRTLIDIDGICGRKRRRGPASSVPPTTLHQPPLTLHLIFSPA